MLPRGRVGASETNFYHRHLRPDRASWKPPQPICFNQMAPISLSKQQQAHFIARLNVNGIIIHNSICAPLFPAYFGVKTN